MATLSATQVSERFKMDASLASATDVCPICKSTAQTSPNLRFKVSPKCYHRICEGCVDRKFSAGKAQCPIQGCTQQLWKRDWKLQTFEDVQIEREVDIRRRVLKTLERREDEFESKLDYDDFLELREELVMNLITDIDVPATNKKLRDYEFANGLRKQTDDNGKPISKLVRKNEGDADPSGLIKGLRKIVVTPPRSPYDPFMGMSKIRNYYELNGSYETRYDQYKIDKQFSSAGYDFEAYMDESLLRAFAGLGVFVGDEMSRANTIPATSGDRQTTKIEDDVF